MSLAPNCGEGFVSLVGAGPGDPELLTIKGYRRLQEAQVVVFDALLDKSFAKHFPPRAEQVFVGKRAGRHIMDQQNINNLLVEKAGKGKRIVRLKGGDPCIFGRGGEEALALLEARINFEIVPGVSALNGAAAAAGIPLTQRGIADGIVAIHGRALLEESWRWNFLNAPGLTLVVFMAAEKTSAVAHKLLELGCSPETPLALVEQAFHPGQSMQNSSLASVATDGMERRTQGPGILFIGETARGLAGLAELTAKKEIYRV